MLPRRKKCPMTTESKPCSGSSGREVFGQDLDLGENSTLVTWFYMVDDIMECTRLSVVFEANIKLDVGVGG